MRQGFEVQESESFYKAKLFNEEDPFNSPTCMMVLSRSDKKSLVELPTCHKVVPAASPTAASPAASAARTPSTANSPAMSSPALASAGQVVLPLSGAERRAPPPPAGWGGVVLGMLDGTAEPAGAPEIAPAGQTFPGAAAPAGAAEAGVADALPAVPAFPGAAAPAGDAEAGADPLAYLDEEFAEAEAAVEAEAAGGSAAAFALAEAGGGS